jgi:signal peptidase I
MSAMLQPRKPLLALSMSLVLPGFGQLYNGEPNRAIWFFLAYLALGLPAIVAIALYIPSALMLGALLLSTCLVVALWIYGMVDAWLRARRQPDFLPRAWQTSGLYALVLIVGALVVQPALKSYVGAHEVESFRLPSSSMEPTLLHGDVIFADKRYNCPNCKSAVQRGDVAIFTYPNDRTLYYVKRIIGLPGERVQIRGRDILVDGRSLTIGTDRELVDEGDALRHWQVTWPAQDPSVPDVDLTVPAGEVYVLGDNRGHSIDSRRFGTVPLSDVVGRVRQVWFSRADTGIRWRRLGKVIE